MRMKKGEWKWQNKGQKMKKMAFLLALCVGVFALSLDEMQTTMQTNIDKSRALLEQFGEDKSGAANEMFKLFDPIFDYVLMARLSLSKNYDKLSPNEKKEFSQAFEIQLKTTFTNYLSLYKNQEIKVTKKEKVKERVFLNATMLVDNEEKSIIFKFHNKNGDWFVYDVDVLGISIIQTYRSQFADLLAKESFATLLEKLKAKSFDVK